MTPVMLLDIDGVINAVTKKTDRLIWPAASWKTGQVEAAGQRPPARGGRSHGRPM